MKKFRFNGFIDGFADSHMVGREFFDMIVGSGEPLRFYPDTIEDRQYLKQRQTYTTMNPTLGAFYPPTTRTGPNDSIQTWRVNHDYMDVGK